MIELAGTHGDLRIEMFELSVCVSVVDIDLDLCKLSFRFDVSRDPFRFANHLFFLDNDMFLNVQHGHTPVPCQVFSRLCIE